MSNVINGVASGYFVDGPKTGPKGEYYIHSVYVDGEKYGAFGNKAAPLANKGDTVQFEWSQNGKYKNFDGKSFKVLERAVAAPSGGKGGSTNDSIARQNACRHATGIVLAFAHLYKTPEQAATAVARISKDIIFPFINDGTVCGEDHIEEDDDSPPF